MAISQIFRFSLVPEYFDYNMLRCGCLWFILLGVLEIFKTVLGVFHRICNISGYDFLCPIYCSNLSLFSKTLSTLFFDYVPYCLLYYYFFSLCFCLYIFYWIVFNFTFLVSSLPLYLSNGDLILYIVHFSFIMSIWLFGVLYWINHFFHWFFVHLFLYFL